MSHTNNNELLQQMESLAIAEAELNPHRRELLDAWQKTQRGFISEHARANHWQGLIRQQAAQNQIRAAANLQAEIARAKIDADAVLAQADLERRMAELRNANLEANPDLKPDTPSELTELQKFANLAATGNPNGDV